MREVRYLEAARAEFLHEIGYFSKISPRLAERFDQAIEKAEVQAAEFADMGSLYKHGTRRVLLPDRFKFSLVYLVFIDHVLVVAVAPFKRRPGYWKGRIAG